MARGFQLDHVAFGARSLTDAAEILAGHLGGAPHEGGPGLGFVGAQWRFEGGGRLEVIEPWGAPDGFLHRFIESRGPGIHHVTFIVPSLVEATAHARAMGYAVVGYNDAFASWKEAFLHPKQAQGVVVQLAEKGDGGDDGWGPGFEFPTPRVRVESPARVVGLWMHAPDLEGPRQLWGDLLGGQATRGPGRAVYRWPDSPLCIHVAVESGEAPGPKGILVEGASDAATRSPWPALGATFFDHRATVG